MKWMFSIFLFLFLTSCVDYTKGVSNICPVHQQKMAKVIKHLKFGYNVGPFSNPDIPFGSLNRAGGCVKSTKQFSIDYLCPYCKKQWIEFEKKSQK